MRERFKGRNQDEAAGGGADRRVQLAGRPGAPAADSEEPSGPGLAGRRQGAKFPLYDSERVYLGVRVKMPVRDLLKNIRLSQGGPPLDPQVQEKRVKADKKRVSSRARCRRRLVRRGASQSLEELAAIVEVLEEDLRSSCASSLSSSHPPPSPRWSPLGVPGCSGEDMDEIVPSPESYRTCSPGGAVERQQVLQVCGAAGAGGQVWAEPLSPDWNLDSSCFFWTQLQKEEIMLGGLADAALLHTDGRGRTSLHQVACVGKRALGYCIAKRMAALNSLDLRDSAGMTALLYAATHNHHLMVADLIQLGADVNAKNKSGKSCLHLSAEKGYVRVLEVLKQAMLDGVYVDVEAADNSGMSVLQCASLAMKAAVRDLEAGKCSRLSALRQEQMMETLECLLQMGSYLHAMTTRPDVG